MKDIRDPIEVTLHYQVYPEHGIIRRNATIRNGTNTPLTLDSAQSAAWYLPPGEGYQLTYLTGRWAAETQVNHEPIHEGTKVLESRKGHTGHNFNPWFAIDAGDAAEENGRVWFGALAWSGNWRITVEQTPYRQVRVTGGFNTFDFAYPLKPGESLETPAFFAGFSESGIGGASRTHAPVRARADLPGRRCSRGSGRCCTTRGRRRRSGSTSRGRRRWRRRRRSSASSCSWWTTAGSARAITTARAWATGL